MVMADVEVTVTDRLESDIERLIDEDEFLNRDQAVEAILAAGLSAYSRTESSSDDLEETFLQSAGEQQDPAMEEPAGEEYTF